MSKQKYDPNVSKQLKKRTINRKRATNTPKQTIKSNINDGNKCICKHLCVLKIVKFSMFRDRFSAKLILMTSC